jgi:hypothetical protein
MKNLLAPIILFILACIINAVIHIWHLPNANIYLLVWLLSGSWLYSQNKVNKLEAQVAALQADIVKGHTA